MHAKLLNITRQEMKVVSTNLMQWQALDDHSFRTVLSDGEGDAIRQQVSDLLVINLNAVDKQSC